MRLRFVIAASALLTAGILVPSALAAFDVPANDNYVTQTVNVLTPEQEDALEQKLAEYDRQTSNQIAILLVESMSGASIVDAAIDTGRAWGVGTEENNNGVLLLIALADREATMQVGYGLEGALPDIVVNGILQEDLKPALLDSQYAEGLNATIDAIEKHVGGEYTAERYEEGGDFPGAGVLFFIVLIGGQLCAAWFARTRSWWAGGIVGGIAGLALALIWSWWVSIPFLIVLGLGFDYVVSKNPGITRSRGRRGPWTGGMGGFGGGSSGGGFGGFGGGSFGGGGSSMKW